MRVVLSVIGKFHTFDLARELHARNALVAVFTGYPRFKLRGEGLPSGTIRPFAYVHTPYMAVPGKHLLGRWCVRQWEQLDRVTLDAYVARHLPPCDVFVGLSGSALRSGRLARSRGARHVCDRGSSHIRTQDALLRDEHERWGVAWPGIDPRAIDREEAEYAEADCITVPSSFAWRSFVARGVPASKLRRLAYGVDLSRFKPSEQAPSGRFDVLFVGGMSLRKGVQYLVQAYARLQHPRKSLTFAGSVDPQLMAILRARKLWPEDARLLGHVPQAQLAALMSRSHVLALPSIEEGLALVQAQAMASGCVVVASDSTGAEDLFRDGEEGWITAARDVDALTARLQRLADRPDEHAAMRARALARVQTAGGWRDYGDQAFALYESLAA